MYQDSIIHHTTFKIRGCEVNFEHKITFPALVQLFQEASLENIINLKLSSWNDHRGSYGWVLLRKEVKVNDYPKLGETVTIETYPSGFDRIFAYRDYKMLDADKKLIAYASSTWTYMNLHTRKLAALPEKLENFDVSQFRQVLSRPKSKIKILDDPTQSIKYIIRRYHLDWNSHVNNNHYFKFVLEVLEPPEQKVEPSEVTIHIKSECLEGDTIIVEAKQMKFESLVTIRKNVNEIVALALVKW